MIKEQRSGRTQRLTAGLLSALLAFAVLGGGIATFLAFSTISAPPAYAEAYRFWGYWHFKDGAWAFPDKGPAEVVPSHGTIEGWRYAISGEAAGQRVPRATVGFEEICGSDEPADGRKKVGLVLDFGLPNESPDGATPPPARAECVEADAEATSAQVLAEVASIRQEDGLFCGIDGYPATGCGDPVADVPTVASPEPTIDLRLPGEDTGDQKTDGNTGDGSAEGQNAGEESTGSAETDNAGADDAADGGSAVWPVVVVAAILVIALGGFWQYRRRGGQG